MVNKISFNIRYLVVKFKQQQCQLLSLIACCIRKQWPLVSKCQQCVVSWDWELVFRIKRNVVSKLFSMVFVFFMMHKLCCLISEWWFCLCSAAVMTRAFPDYIGDRRDLFLLQSIASYLLLGCGVVYVVSVRSLKRTNYLVI